MSKIKVVYAPMACDLIHRGHIEFLKRAKCLGDFLIIGLYSDETFILQQKPFIMPYADRKAILETVYLVNMVVEDCMHYRRPSTIDNLTRFKVDILAYGNKGAEYRYQILKDQELCKTVLINRYDDVTTPTILNKIIKEYS